MSTQFLEETFPTQCDGRPVPDPGRQWLVIADGVRVGHLFVGARYRGRLDAALEPSHRNQGIACRLYLHVAKILGRLEADTSEQSPDAGRLWERLALTHRVERSNGFVTLYPQEIP